jgi:DtxR family Mn-dependent transcriptional regulator
MITEVDQNYLKEIYLLEQDRPTVSTSMLAARFSVSPATVTGMLKKLAARGWVDYQPYKGVHLSEPGRAIALEVVRHHRLIETYLARSLDVPWDRIHDEAEKLEHVLSDYLEERIDAQLGHPTSDPHGSPIPGPDGSVPEEQRVKLAGLKVGVQAVIAEVDDRNPEILARLDSLGLHPETQVEVIDIEAVDGLITLQVSGETQVLGPMLASHIYVKPIEQPSMLALDMR